MNALVSPLLRLCGSGIPANLLKKSNAIRSTSLYHYTSVVQVQPTTLPTTNKQYYNYHHTSVVQPTINKQCNNNSTSSLGLCLLLGGSAAVFSSSHKSETASCTPTPNLGAITVLQRADFDDTLKNSVFYGSNDPRTLASKSNTTNSGLSPALVNSELTRLQNEINVATTPYKTLPDELNIPGPMPNAVDRLEAVDRDIDNFTLAVREGKVLFKKIDLVDLDKEEVDVNDIKVFPSFPQGDLRLSATRCDNARGSSCPYDILHLSSSFGGSNKNADQAMIDYGDAYHFNMPPFNISYSDNLPRLTMSDIGISRALHGSAAHGGNLDPKYNFLNWHKPPHLAPIQNLWVGNLDNPPAAHLRNGHYHCFPSMEPGQTLDTYISRISQDRWGALTNHARTQYGWYDGGMGFVNSGFGVNTIKPGNWQAKKFMAHHCQHYNRQVNRLADPDVAFRSTAWRDPRRYDQVRNNHLGPAPLYVENYTARSAELLEVMGDATAYLAGGNTLPSRIPNRAEDGKSIASYLSCFQLDTHF